MNIDMEAVTALNLDVIVSDLVRGGLEQSEAVRATRMYRQFLETIAAHPDITLVPSKLIDKAWHAHMSRPRKYCDDCMAAFGTIIDHQPGVYGTTNYEAAYAITRSLVPYDMPADYRAVSEMAGAECWRRPQEPGEGSEDPLSLAA